MEDKEMEELKKQMKEMLELQKLQMEMEMSKKIQEQKKALEEEQRKQTEAARSPPKTDKLSKAEAEEVMKNVDLGEVIIFAIKKDLIKRQGLGGLEKKTE
jgi:hypothetical protein